MKGVHEKALDALRAELLARLSDARANIRWSRGYEAPRYLARSFERAREIVAQLRALGAVRRAANESFDAQGAGRPW